MKFKTVFTGAFLLAVLSFNVYGASKEVPTEPYVDLNKYLGTWYEVASLPAWFSKECVSDVVAKYSMREDNEAVLVDNSCKTKDGSIKKDEGQAFVEDTKTNAFLKVSFVPFFQKWGFFGGDYKIIKLAKDYSYALVGDSDKKYLWILSRKPSLSLENYDKLVKVAKEIGFDVSKLEKKPHSENK